MAEISRFARQRLRLLAALPLMAALPAALPAAHADSFVDYFRAVQIDREPVVRKLLQRGFDPNAVEATRGENGLIIALRYDAMEVFRLLLDAPGINLNARALNGDNALMMACFKGNKPAVEALLAREAEVNQPGWTPLHYAAYGGHNEIVAMLLEKSAYIDAESPNKTTPIMMAASAGHIMTVKLLLDEGADVTLKNDAGMTAIDFADKNGHKDIAEGLASRLSKSGKP